jgi:hypothetical protein
MADDEFELVDVTGRWTGFYRYIFEGMPPFPIVAEIIQTGSQLSGEMYDQITDTSDTLERYLETRRAEIPVTLAWRVEETIRQLGNKTMVVSTRLPDTSDIEGTIHGDQVEFTKFYRGTVRYQSTIDGELFKVREVTGHRVHYSGRLDGEAGHIAGRWIIRWRGLFSRLLPPKGWGSFELYKK